MYNSNLPVDNQYVDHIPDQEVSYFKKSPYFLRENRPMTDEEIEKEIEAKGENQEVLYENGEPVGILELWKEKTI